jgi:hypothetical protein
VTGFLIYQRQNEFNFRWFRAGMSGRASPERRFLAAMPAEQRTTSSRFAMNEVKVNGPWTIAGDDPDIWHRRWTAST